MLNDRARIAARPVGWVTTGLVVVVAAANIVGCDRKTEKAPLDVRHDSIHGSASVAESAATASAKARKDRGAVKPHAHAWWTARHAERILDGKRVLVDGKRIRLDRATLVCGGAGRSRGKGRRRTWSHFRCIQPTFTPSGSAGPDALFLLHAVSRTSFLITDAQLTHY